MKKLITIMNLLHHCNFFKVYNTVNDEQSRCDNRKLKFNFFLILTECLSLGMKWTMMVTFVSSSNIFPFVTHIIYWHILTLTLQIKMPVFSINQSSSVWTLFKLWGKKPKEFQLMKPTSIAGCVPYVQSHLLR